MGSNPPGGFPAGTSAPSVSEFLDQSEIDRLLMQSEGGPAKSTVIRADGRAMPPGSAPLGVEAYDFRNPAFLTEAELRRLRLVHEDFIRYLSARLSLFLRMEFGLKMARLTTLNYSRFTDSLASPTHICLFKTEPLLGVGILDLSPRLALSLADRMLGGRGHSVKTERQLTEIEVALIEDVAMIILDEWCNQWKAEQELRPAIIGHENNGRFLQTSPKDAILLVLSLEVNFGDCAEQIQLGIPYYTIEPVVKKMQARRQKDSSVSKTPEKRAAWQDTYNHITIPAHAEWNAFDLSLREIVNLRVGDVIEMPATILERTELVLAGVPKFAGQVGLEGDRVALQLTRKIHQTQPIPPHAKSQGR